MRPSVHALPCHLRGARPLRRGGTHSRGEELHRAVSCRRGMKTTGNSAARLGSARAFICTSCSEGFVAQSRKDIQTHRESPMNQGQSARRPGCENLTPCLVCSDSVAVCRVLPNQCSWLRLCPPSPHLVTFHYRAGVLGEPSAFTVAFRVRVTNASLTVSACGCSAHGARSSVFGASVNVCGRHIQARPEWACGFVVFQ